jgi:NADH:ubiquinone oxidoreductase subunit
MAKIKLFGALSNLQMLLFTALRGRKAGSDHLGNVYYTGKPRAGDRSRGQPRERRWVVYKDVAEASLVPAEWHGWLHHQTDAVPGDSNPLRQPWQQPHQPNQTGSTAAYFPPGHANARGRRDAATGDYQPWQPPQ